MNLSFRRKITSFLGSEGVTCGEKILSGISPAIWQLELGWLDRSGLILPLIDTIQRRSLQHVLPSRMLEPMRQRLRDNETRMRQMLAAFAQITQLFNEQSITYACVKGFSLIPDWLSSISCRHQSDFDFLIAEPDIEIAEQILLHLGYRVLAKEASGERRYATFGSEVKGKDAYLYTLQESHAAELHLYFWEPEDEEMQLSFPIHSLDCHLEMHTIDGVSFPRLQPALQMVYQLLHFFRHLSGTWARLLWLYEIAQFTADHFSDEDLWREANGLWQNDAKLKQVCHLVLRLAARTFSVPLPALIESDADVWEACQRWLGHFSDYCLYVDLPGNKASLLLMRPFFEDMKKYRRYRARRLFPFGHGHVLDERLSPVLARSLKYRLRNLRYQFSRVRYHLSANLHFLMLKLQWTLRILSDKVVKHRATTSSPVHDS
jgi:Uncharacterised nucleotidyltransferase